MASRRKSLWLAAILFIAVGLALAAIPIIHPLRFFGQTRDLTIRGYLLPHGGERGIHIYDTGLERGVRLQSVSIDFWIVAWEFILETGDPNETA